MDENVSQTQEKSLVYKKKWTMILKQSEDQEKKVIMKKTQIPNLPKDMKPAETQNFNNTTTRQDESLKHIILINLTEEPDKSNFHNPIKLTDALNQSIFQKYIIGDSFKDLGTGRAVRSEVNSLTKLPSLNQITKLGDWNVFCKQPTSNKNIGCPYGTIYPVETQLEPKEIIDKIRPLLGYDSEIVEVIRINTINNDKQS